MIIVNKPITFIDTSTGNTGSYWSFGDGTGGVSGKIVSHIYHSPGTYNVAHRITSNSDEKICSKYITVSSSPKPAQLNLFVIGSVVVVAASFVYLLLKKD